MLTLLLKTSAYLVTGSVALLSDAVESIVNVVGGFMALWMLKVAAQPADEEHTYGHSKAEYFSSGIEGGLILVAAGGIAAAAVPRLIKPQPLRELGLGLAVAMAASVINLIIALLLLRAGKKHNSITLEANAHHLFTDVWTGVGVVIGVIAVATTGWQRLDPIVAMVVATVVVWTGVNIVRRSISGLMDVALSDKDMAAIRKVMQIYEQQGIQFHAVRSRQAGARKFVSTHVLVPGDWTVHRGHELLDKFEADIRSALPEASIFTHLESLEDPSSWNDESFERRGP